MKLKIRDQVKDMDVVTVSLVENFTNNAKMFHCPTCRNPIFQYKGRLVKILPGYTPTKIPTIHRCSNRSCGVKYLIVKILSKQVDV